MFSPHKRYYVLCQNPSFARHSRETGCGRFRRRKWSRSSIVGSIKGDVKRKHSPLPHGDGEGRCLASSPVCGSVVERGVARYPGPSVAAFFVPCGSACKQRGGNVPTMVLSETRGLWLCWVVRGCIRWPVRLIA